MDGAPGSSQSRSATSSVIVGAGVTGLVCARALLEAGISVVVVEAAQDLFVGCNRECFAADLAGKFPDLAELLSLPEFRPPSGCRPDDLHGYLLAYVDHFKLRDHIIFSCRLEHAQISEDGRWVVVCSDLQDPHRLHRLTSDFLIISAGGCLTRSLPQLPGAADFAGLRCHPRDFYERQDAASLVSGQHVVVAGDDRTAVWCSRWAEEAGAASVTLLFRQPHWPLPNKLCGRALPLLAYNRFLPSLLFPPYYTAGSAVRAMSSALRPLRKLFWWRLEQRLIRKYGVDEATRPPVHIMRDMFYSTQASPCDDNWVGVLQGTSVRLIRGDISRLDTDCVVLNDHSTLQCTALVHCTPSSRNYTVFDPELHATLGVRKDGLHLYRSLVHPLVPSLAFLGCGSTSPYSWLTVSLQAAWVAQLASGRLRLPGLKEMKADVYRQRRWRRRAFPPQPNRGSMIQWYAQAYHDQLLSDLGLPVHVKVRNGCTPLFSSCTSYTPAVYRPLFSSDESPYAGTLLNKRRRRASGFTAGGGEFVESSSVHLGGYNSPTAARSGIVAPSAAAVAALSASLSQKTLGNRRVSVDRRRSLDTQKRLSTDAACRAVLAQVSVTSNASRLHLFNTSRTSMVPGGDVTEVDVEPQVDLFSSCHSLVASPLDAPPMVAAAGGGGTAPISTPSMFLPPGALGQMMGAASLRPGGGIGFSRLGSQRGATMGAAVAAGMAASAAASTSFIPLGLDAMMHNGGLDAGRGLHSNSHPEIEAESHVPPPPPLPSCGDGIIEAAIASQFLTARGATAAAPSPETTSHRGGSVRRAGGAAETDSLDTAVTPLTALTAASTAAVPAEWRAVAAAAAVIRHGYRGTTNVQVSHRHGVEAHLERAPTQRQLSSGTEDVDLNYPNGSGAPTDLLTSQPSDEVPGVMSTAMSTAMAGSSCPANLNFGLPRSRPLMISGIANRTTALSREVTCEVPASATAATTHHVTHSPEGWSGFGAQLLSAHDATCAAALGTSVGGSGISGDNTAAETCRAGSSAQNNVVLDMATGAQGVSGPVIQPEERDTRSLLPMQLLRGYELLPVGSRLHQQERPVTAVSEPGGKQGAVLMAVADPPPACLLASTELQQPLDVSHRGPGAGVNPSSGSIELQPPGSDSIAAAAATAAAIPGGSGSGGGYSSSGGGGTSLRAAAALLATSRAVPSALLAAVRSSLTLRSSASGARGLLSPTNPVASKSAVTQQQRHPYLRSPPVDGGSTASNTNADFDVLESPQLRSRLLQHHMLYAQHASSSSLLVLPQDRSSPTVGRGGGDMEGLGTNASAVGGSGALPAPGLLSHVAAAVSTGGGSLAMISPRTRRRSSTVAFRNVLGNDDFVQLLITAGNNDGRPEGIIDVCQGGAGAGRLMGDAPGAEAPLLSSPSVSAVAAPSLATSLAQRRPSVHSFAGMDHVASAIPAGDLIATLHSASVVLPVNARSSKAGTVPRSTAQAGLATSIGRSVPPGVTTLAAASASVSVVGSSGGRLSRVASRGPSGYATYSGFITPNQNREGSVGGSGGGGGGGYCSGGGSSGRVADGEGSTWHLTNYVRHLTSHQMADDCPAAEVMPAQPPRSSTLHALIPPLPHHPTHGVQSQPPVNVGRLTSKSGAKREGENPYHVDYFTAIPERSATLPAHSRHSHSGPHRREARQPSAAVRTAASASISIAADTVAVVEKDFDDDDDEGELREGSSLLLVPSGSLAVSLKAAVETLTASHYALGTPGMYDGHDLSRCNDISSRTSLPVAAVAPVVPSTTLSGGAVPPLATPQLPPNGSGSRGDSGGGALTTPPAALHTAKATAKAAVLAQAGAVRALYCIQRDCSYPSLPSPPTLQPQKSSAAVLGAEPRRQDSAPIRDLRASSSKQTFLRRGWNALKSVLQGKTDNMSSAGDRGTAGDGRSDGMDLHAEIREAKGPGCDILLPLFRSASASRLLLHPSNRQSRQCTTTALRTLPSAGSPTMTATMAASTQSYDMPMATALGRSRSYCLTQDTPFRAIGLGGRGSTANGMVAEVLRRAVRSGSFTVGGASGGMSQMHLGSSNSSFRAASPGRGDSRSPPPPLGAGVVGVASPYLRQKSMLGMHALSRRNNTCFNGVNGGPLSTMMGTAFLNHSEVGELSAADYDVLSVAPSSTRSTVQGMSSMVPQSSSVALAVDAVATVLAAGVASPTGSQALVSRGPLASPNPPWSRNAGCSAGTGTPSLGTLERNPHTPLSPPLLQPKCSAQRPCSPLDDGSGGWRARSGEDLVVHSAASCSEASFRMLTGSPAVPPLQGRLSRPVASASTIPTAVSPGFSSLPPPVVCFNSPEDLSPKAHSGHNYWVRRGADVSSSEGGGAGDEGGGLAPDIDAMTATPHSPMDQLPTRAVTMNVSQHMSPQPIRSRVPPRRHQSLLRMLLSPVNNFGGSQVSGSGSGSEGCGINVSSSIGRSSNVAAGWPTADKQSVRRAPKRVVSELARSLHATGPALVYGHSGSGGGTAETPAATSTSAATSSVHRWLGGASMLRVLSPSGPDTAAPAAAALPAMMDKEDYSTVSGSAALGGGGAHSPTTSSPVVDAGKAPGHVRRRRAVARRDSIIGNLLADMAGEGLGAAIGPLAAPVATGSQPPYNASFPVVNPHAPEGVIAWERPRAWDEAAAVEFSPADSSAGSACEDPLSSHGTGSDVFDCRVPRQFAVPAAAVLPSVMLGHVTVPTAAPTPAVAALVVAASPLLESHRSEPPSGENPLNPLWCGSRQA